MISAARGHLGHLGLETENWTRPAPATRTASHCGSPGSETPSTRVDFRCFAGGEFGIMSRGNVMYVAESCLAMRTAAGAAAAAVAVVLVLRQVILGS